MTGRAHTRGHESRGARRDQRRRRDLRRTHGQTCRGHRPRASAVLLGQAGREGTDAARLLTRLIPLKNRAEYEPDDVPKATATRAVDQAERVVEIAQQVAG